MPQMFRIGRNGGRISRLFLICSCLVVSAEPDATRAAVPPDQAIRTELVRSGEPGWPQWRGPKRDGICEEKGLLQTWPEGGPKPCWHSAGLGKGYSAPVISGERIFLAGDVQDDLLVFALDLDGRLIWRATNGASWRAPYPGARASCTYASGRILHMNAHAQVTSFEASSGRKVWSVDLRERFGSRKITWATSECLLVDGSRVVVTAGGSGALMAAIDIATGIVVWTTPALREGTSGLEVTDIASGAGADGPSYASPVLISVGGRRQIVGCSQQHVFGVDADSGRLMWARPLRTRHDVIAMTPVVLGDGFFVTAPHTEDGKRYRFRVDNGTLGVQEVWTTKLDTCHGGAVLLADAIYGSWYSNGKGWACVDAQSGSVRYESRAMAKGSVLYADNRLYILSEEGEMVLVRPTPTEFDIQGKFQFVQGRRNDVWTHPVIHNGRMYLRYHEKLSAYDIRAGIVEGIDGPGG